MSVYERPWRDGLVGYDPGRVSVVEIEDPDAVTDEDLAAMLAAEGVPVAAPVQAATKTRTANQIMGEQVRSARRLRDRFAAAKRDTVRQLVAGAEIAFLEALRHAGVRAITKARNKSTRAAAQTVASAFENRQSLQPFFAALGVTEMDLLAGSFGAYQTQTAAWLEAQQREMQRIIRQEHWEDEEAALAPGDDHTIGLAAAFLAGSLFALAASRILSGDDPTVEAKGEVSGVIPTGLVVRTLDVAAGRAHVTMGESPTDMPTLTDLQTRSIEGVIADGLRERLRDSLTGELRARRESGADEGPIRDALDGLDTEVPLTEYVWVHGFYGEPRQDFEPHQRLNGERFTGGPADGDRSPVEEDDRLINDTGWPDSDYYFPGDHLGCTCELVAQVPSALDAYVDAVA